MTDIGFKDYLIGAGFPEKGKEIDVMEEPELWGDL